MRNYVETAFGQNALAQTKEINLLGVVNAERLASQSTISQTLVLEDETGSPSILFTLSKDGIPLGLFRYTIIINDTNSEADLQIEEVRTEPQNSDSIEIMALKKNESSQSCIAVSANGDILTLKLNNTDGHKLEKVAKIAFNYQVYLA